MKKSICIFLVNELGQIAAVRRKQNTSTVCFPGGKVDPGEDIITAVIRETEEEIGVTLMRDELMVLRAGVCHDDYHTVDYWATCFYATRPSSTELFTHEPHLSPQWMGIDEFNAKSVFKDYNLEVFKVARKLGILGIVSIV